MRVVKVYVADPDTNVPLRDRLLYQGAEQVTDLTDQELFYEIDIKRLLDEHNQKRGFIVDKKASEKMQGTAYLEPIRIRDLKMVVVDIATF